ncbi:MAG: hypothetical protein ACJ8C3_07220 [Microvirga sp.]|jgi:hypothetical protein
MCHHHAKVRLVNGDGALGDRQTELILKQNGDPRALLANAIIILRTAPQWSGVLGHLDRGPGDRRLENCEQTGVLARKDRLHVCAAGETLGNELSAAHRSPEVQGSKPGMLGFSGLLSVRGECEQLGGGASHLRTGLSPKAPVIVVFWGAPRASGRGHVTNLCASSAVYAVLSNFEHV